MSTIEAGKNPRDIILKPVTTEKSLALMDLGKYTFEVDPRANKTEIKIALDVSSASRSVPSRPRTARARPTAPVTGSVSARTSSVPSSPCVRAPSTSSAIRPEGRRDI